MAWNFRRNDYHWNYFLLLEEDVLRILRFIEPHQTNFGSFSIELAKALLAIGAETDVVCKLLVKSRLGKEVDNMGECRKLISADLLDFPELVVDVPRYGLQLRPWSAWRDGSKTQWWNAYTNLKHDRGGAFTQANLGNVLDAIAGLFTSVLLYLKSVEVDAIAPFPALLRPPLQLGEVVTESRNGLIIDLRVN